jgi:hypothetical protein
MKLEDKADVLESQLGQEVVRALLIDLLTHDEQLTR